jgi:peptidoglycan/xylan/chitin deacetylase (PgdA/CDA1 family)
LAAVAKHTIEAAAVRSGVPRLARRRLRGRTLILAYHNVIDTRRPSTGDASLHIELSRFQDHLDVIERLCDVIPPTALEMARRSGLRPQLIITFDDAYRGAVRLALPELKRRNLPATVFVAPGFVPDRTFWWDDVARNLGGLSASNRLLALEQLRGRDAIARHRWAAATVAGIPPDERCATIDELNDAVATGPVLLGSHTWSHPNLARATPEELTEELSRPLEWLREAFPRTHIAWLSYPYGLETPQVRVAARGAGYACGLRVSGGWIPRHGVDPLALPRLNVPAGLSASGLALRLSGLLAS